MLLALSISSDMVITAEILILPKRPAWGEILSSENISIERKKKQIKRAGINKWSSAEVDLTLSFLP